MKMGFGVIADVLQFQFVWDVSLCRWISVFFDIPKNSIPIIYMINPYMKMPDFELK